MRIKFLREVEVELNAIPNVAWGRILKRPRTSSAPSSAPSINPENQQFELPTSEMRNVFPVGAIVELPDELAAKYVADGSAQAYVGPQGHQVPHDRNAALGSVAQMEALN